MKRNRWYYGICFLILVAGCEPQSVDPTLTADPLQESDEAYLLQARLQLNHLAQMSDEDVHPALGVGMQLKSYILSRTIRAGKTWDEEVLANVDGKARELLAKVEGTPAETMAKSLVGQSMLEYFDEYKTYPSSTPLAVYYAELMVDNMNTEYPLLLHVLDTVERHEDVTRSLAHKALLNLEAMERVHREEQGIALHIDAKNLTTNEREPVNLEETRRTLQRLVQE